MPANSMSGWGHGWTSNSPGQNTGMAGGAPNRSPETRIYRQIARYEIADKHHNCGSNMIWKVAI